MSSADPQMFPLPHDRAAQLRQLTHELATGLARQLDAPQPPVRRLINEGLARLDSARARYRHSKRVDDATAVRLAMDLRIIRIRDEAWYLAHTEPVTMCAMLLDVSERTAPELWAPVGAVLGAALWAHGRLDLAHRTVHEVLTIEPSYPMAQMLDVALHFGIPETIFRTRLLSAADWDIEMGDPVPHWLWPLQRTLAVYLHTDRDD
ncbi:DUF4192 family protein [Nonomuraea aridisoli]|nr:DUF4192 family protein [Nonomuraea aridisoli]